MFSCFQTASEGARTSLFLADSDAVRNVNGHYFSDCAPKTPSLRALDDGLSEEIFQRSCQLTGISNFFEWEKVGEEALAVERANNEEVVEGR